MVHYSITDECNVITVIQHWSGITLRYMHYISPCLCRLSPITIISTAVSLEEMNKLEFFSTYFQNSEASLSSELG